MYLVLAITIIFLSPVRSEEINGTNNSTMNNTPELLARISVSSVVYETNPNSFAVFGDNSIDPAKQEIYRINVTNNGEVSLDDVIVSISAEEGMIFKNFAYFDSSSHLKLECNQPDLCQRASTYIIKNLGTLEPDETRSVLISAYIKYEVDNRQIKINAVGAKTNGTVSDMQDSAELARCFLAYDNGTRCAEQLEGCTCKRPDWIPYAFIASNVSTKPQIHLEQINLTSTIVEIKTANQVWSESNTGNGRDFQSYTPNIGDQVYYQISVSNEDSINSLKDISIVSQLPYGMVYVSSSITEDESGSRQILPDKVRDNEITWSIAEIKPNTQVLIKHVAAFLNNNPRRFENKVYAKGIWDTEYALIEDQSQVVSSVLPA